MDADSPITELVRLTAPQKAALRKLGIGVVRDLLYHLPARYESPADVRTIAEVADGETAVFYGQFTKLETKKSWKTKVPMAEGSFSDDTGTLRVVWFHQPYLAKMIPLNAPVRLRGKISVRNGRKQVANPEVEKTAAVPYMELRPQGGSAPVPVYPESAGITSLWFHHAVKRAIEEGTLDHMEDPLPPELLKKYNLPSLKTALIYAHQPQRESDAEVARKRFAFEEVFLIQLARAREREENRERRAFAVDADEAKVAAFVHSFPFKATAGQEKAIADILADFLEPYPMARLLEGDVGSGKTAVAAATAYAVATSRPNGQKNFGNLQVAYMCPTEILAKQHFATFTSFFKEHPIQIGLITSSGCYKFPSKVNPEKPTDISRPQFLKWVQNGEIPIVIGTHALIQKTVGFKHLAYVIVDEQHRFGTAQRHAIATKGDAAPHLLSMTATPIPRTLALTLYGDLDLTVLDQLPAGRKPIQTEIISAAKRGGAYEKVRALLNEGRQAYVICPRIDEPDPKKALALQTRSVASELKRLKNEVFPEFTIDKLHSKMTPKEKEETMAKFERGETQILVATSVVEVGVNVPNATVIMIEGAERFGLAQLHQLRGRVMRSTYEPYCFLMVDRGSGDTARLKAIQSAKNGFELAEKDLEIRGAGELYGRRQWGISDIGMDALKNLKLVEAARAEAQAVVEKDPSLSKHTLLKERSKETVERLHFE
ncbi:MAG: ATP-dependent DNA helicase RecG [Patescibacteria group bacterium]|nr:ATP-dependent DNA helicase RecG [Patescibacteria group bacterium]